MANGAWVSLFSGGKDSSFALYRALETGLSVERLVVVHPSPESYMYHVPATDLVGLAAESIGISLLEVDSGDLEAETATDASVQGDTEIEPLEAALADLDTTLDGGVAGVIAGAVESEFQASRIEALCDRLDIELFAPLWRHDPRTLADAMCNGGFVIRMVQVAADGLDESWLGRRLDADAFEDLAALGESHGVHVLGEGGEFETLVTDGPHMARPIELEYDVEWAGTRGRLRITDAWLGRVD